MKAIILAGGTGSRLYPSTQVVSKQLLPVYSAPLLYHSLTFLMNAKIRDFVIITNTEYVDTFKQLIKDGSQWGVNIDVIPQEAPNGIAEAFILAEEYIKGDDCILMLGDNMFYGYTHLRKDLANFGDNDFGSMIYGYEVSNPSRYGVIEFAKNGTVMSLEEKPETPKSNFAAVGLYVVDGTVSERAKDLKPSPRGELEITDLMRTYLEEESLVTKKFDRGVTWLDAGTTSSMADAIDFVKVIEVRSGVMVACPEEIALKQKFITKKQFKTLTESYPKCVYTEYLKRLL